MTIQIGPYTSGERPAPLRYTYLDHDGAPIDLTGYTASFNWQADGVVVTQSATVADEQGGVVEHAWTATDLAAPGLHKAEFFVTNGSNTYASERIIWLVRAAIA